MAKSAAIKVNRTPVLMLWAAVVAVRLGHPPETALSLAKAVAGTATRAKAKRLGIADEGNKAKERKDAAPARRKDSTQLLGRKIRLTHDKDGVVLADDGGKPSPAKPVEAYVAETFGDRRAEVRKAMECLAARYEPQELDRVGFRLYEHFRPEVPSSARGWGAKGLLDVEERNED